MFLTSNIQLPVYSQFNVTQSMVYFSVAELLAFRVAPIAASSCVRTVTAAYFNPIAHTPPEIFACWLCGGMMTNAFDGRLITITMQLYNPNGRPLGPKYVYDQNYSTSWPTARNTPTDR